MTVVKFINEQLMAAVAGYKLQEEIMLTAGESASLMYQCQTMDMFGLYLVRMRHLCYAAKVE